MVSKAENSLEELRKMRNEIHFTQEEIKDMLKESKKAWGDKGRN